MTDKLFAEENKKVQYMDERYIAAVDLGSSKIALTVAKVSGNDIQIQYYKETPSMGIRNSAVFNPKNASEPIQRAIEEAEDELKIKILQAVVCLPRCDVRQENNSAKAERSQPDECISCEEVEELKNLALDGYPNIDSEKESLYGAVAQSFDCDDNFQIIESDIVGMVSRDFVGNFKLFIGKKSSVKTIDKVFNNLGIAIAKQYFTPDATAKAVLTEDEKESGVALIDLGGGATSVTIYKGKILRHYASIPFGGKSITIDIKNECTISESLAENIKLAYGACMPDKLQTLAEKIIQIEGEEGMTGPKQIPVQYLSEIITCRVKEIIDAMLYEIQQSGLADALRSGIVITGGGANLANIAPFIKECSGYNVRIGLPRPLFSADHSMPIRTTSATTSIGMILSAKTEPLLNCVDPVQSSSEDEIEVISTQDSNDFIERVSDIEYSVADEVTEAKEEQQEPDPETVTKQKKEKPKKDPVEKKPSILKIKWNMIVEKLENLYDQAGKENN